MNLNQALWPSDNLGEMLRMQEFKICQNHFMDFAKLSYGCVKFVVWICQSCCVDLSKLCLSRPLPKETRPKFDQHFEAR